jgi:hypothetical protein
MYSKNVVENCFLWETKIKFSNKQMRNEYSNLFLVLKSDNAHEHVYESKVFFDLP